MMQVNNNQESVEPFPVLGCSQEKNKKGVKSSRKSFAPRLSTRLHLGYPLGCTSAIHPAAPRLSTRLHLG
jgi:hypothetical protein